VFEEELEEPIPPRPEAPRAWLQVIAVEDLQPEESEEEEGEYREGITRRGDATREQLNQPAED
jgi:hypothetical protein